jgi:hypothetical protein
MEVNLPLAFYVTPVTNAVAVPDAAGVLELKSSVVILLLPSVTTA